MTERLPICEIFLEGNFYRVTESVILLFVQSRNSSDVEERFGLIEFRTGDMFLVLSSTGSEEGPYLDKLVILTAAGDQYILCGQSIKERFELVCGS